MTPERIKKILPAIKERISYSEIRLSKGLRVAVAEKILNIMSLETKHFGMFVIVGWQSKWNTYTDISDSYQDIFAKKRINIMAEGQSKIATTIDFDGAILIDNKGNICHSGVIIEGLRPSLIASKINPGKFQDLSEQFGFTGKVHSRHLSAIAASYVFKNTTVYTVSEENDGFHIYEGGIILYEWNK